ncbi:hypothetical protein ERO13_A09G223725v2 [Gossypium hirsutum]|nr:hypothetical protein ERO13_A09G223725v2 [Gossypium hirsutum]
MLCLCRPFGYLLCFLWFLSNGKTVAVLGLMAVGFEFFTACWVFLCWTFANYNDQCCFYSNKLASEKDLNSKRADLKEKSQQALWIALRLIVFLAMAPLGSYVYDIWVLFGVLLQGKPVMNQEQYGDGMEER